jgi:hypothetical protein
MGLSVKVWDRAFLNIMSICTCCNWPTTFCVISSLLQSQLVLPGLLAQFIRFKLLPGGSFCNFLNNDNNNKEALSSLFAIQLDGSTDVS